MFSHCSLFQSNCSIHDACPPSVHKANENPLLPSHVCESRGVGSDCEFPSPFYFHHHHSKLFSQLLFPIKLLSHWQRWPPSLSWQVKQELPLPSPGCMLCGKGSDGEFSSQFHFPHPFDTCSHSSSNLIAILLAA